MQMEDGCKRSLVHLLLVSPKELQQMTCSIEPLGIAEKNVCVKMAIQSRATPISPIHGRLVVSGHIECNAISAN